jgi:cytoskeleton protein RodZ
MSFGENLRRERELRGIELRDIADATKISMRFLQALEQDRPEVLPGGIFPQAFVRQYARHLGLDAEKTVAEFLYANRGVVVEKAPRPREPRPSSHRGVLVFLFLAVWAGIFAWRGRTSSEPVRIDTGAAATTPVTYPPSNVYPPPMAASAPAPSANGALVMKLTARQSAWVKVQVDRVTVLNRTLAQDDTQTFEARDEIVLSVGNAGGVAYSLNGRPAAPLGPEGKVRNVVINRENWESLVAGTPHPAAAAPHAGPASAEPPQTAPAGAPSPGP